MRRKGGGVGARADPVALAAAAAFTASFSARFLAIIYLGGGKINLHRVQC
ncbi:hypothetical protein TIFTF001_028411 [Ficus carica]|uniref:Uncharacterized protein n=1 Tax=Ficus carica TaxID=3494 RepID=A0AA88IWH5_FICCA|nr:hypothetical protein TIFTF001_028411 [Ficus carica]